jgi:DNA polymerase V
MLTAPYTGCMYSTCGFKSNFSSPVPLAETGLVLPLAGDRVCAGFPSPAEDFAVKRIDLTEVLITHPQATFLLRVSGESMKDAGIFDGDMLVVNKALKPCHGHIVVAVVDGEFTVKYLYQRGGRVKLRAANVTFPEITPKDGQTLEVWGVVTSCIKRFVP